MLNAEKLYGACGAALLFTGCAGPQSTLDPAGESARLIAGLWWGMIAWFTPVLFAVIGLWIYAMRRRGEPVGHERAHQLHRRWVIGGGLILPIVSVVAIFIAGVPVGKRLLHPAADNRPPLRIEVTGHQWWWEIHYPATGVTAAVTTANQLYLPTDVPLDFHITSSDVIHSFWIPRLGGKIDAIPGRINRLRLIANEAGYMRGQCAEFCGTGHAHMVFSVEAVAPAQFERWLQARQQPITVAPEHRAAAASFRAHCGDCHSVNGVSPGGAGPDLSDIGLRSLPGDSKTGQRETAIETWLTNPDSRRWSPRSVDHRTLAPDDISAISSWLETLGQ